MLLVVPFLIAVSLLWIIQALVALLLLLLLDQVQLPVQRHLVPVAFGAFFLFLPSEQVLFYLPQHYLEQALVLFLVVLLYLLMANIQQCWVFLLVLNPMP